MLYRRLAAAAAAMAMICALSGCARPATRRELIRWFRDTCADAPLVVARDPVVRDNDEIYEAYLEAYPERKFYIKSDYSYVMEHSVFHNRSNFDAVYGSYYFSQYRKEHPVRYAEYVYDEDRSHFSLNVYYRDRSELAEAFDELYDLQRYLDSQEYPVKAWHHIYFESPLCDRKRLAHTLGSGVIDLTGEDPSGAVIRARQRDLESDLAVWCRAFRLHEDWFAGEELERALAYRESGEYGGSRHAYTGSMAVYDGEVRAAYYPQIAAPSVNAVTFRMLYQILSDTGWETLEGDEERFSFTGADGVLYQFSYAMQDTGRDYLTCTWLADGVPYDGFGSEEGYISSDYTFHKITGLRLEMPAGG